MKTDKPLWMNEPEAEQTSIRFSCPHCFEWIRKQEFEKHLQEKHPQEKHPHEITRKLRALTDK